MEKYLQYEVHKKIKLYTKPLVEAVIIMNGTYLKQTKSYFIFDTFRVNKNNVELICPIKE